MTRIIQSFIESVRRYRRDTKGQFAVLIGMVALPLLVSASFAVDFNRAESLRSGVKAALDSAALAAVTNQTLTTEERAEFAKSYFYNNFARSQNFELSVNSSTGGQVSLTAKGFAEVTIGRSIGIDVIGISETSVAVTTQNDTICVLALNPDGEGAFSVADGSVFEANACSVQINSTHPLAASVDPYSQAHAKSFCIGGGAVGAFFPFVNTECSTVADPYAGYSAPEPGPCISDKKIDLKVGKKINKNKYGTLVEDETIAVVGDSLILTPGTYCSRLRITGFNVTFLPGVYILKNAPLEFKKGASAKADGVTFILYGDDSSVLIEGGSSLYLKSPTEGPWAGIAIFQDAKAALMDKKGRFLTDETEIEYPTAVSELKGGSSMEVLGTVYLPTQELRVGSDSGMGTRSPATSYIGYNVAFEGGSRISVSVENATYGLPDVARQSDDSARLIQ